VKPDRTLSGESPLADAGLSGGKTPPSAPPVFMAGTGEAAGFSSLVQAASFTPGRAGAPPGKEEPALAAPASAPAGGVVESGSLATTTPKALPLFDLPVKGQPGSALIDQIAHQFSLRLREGQGEIQLKLDPPSLGAVRMSVAATGDTVRALLVTDHPAVKQVIENQLHQLRETLAGQGMKVDSFTVLVGGHDAGGGSHPAPRNGAGPAAGPQAPAAPAVETDRPAPPFRPPGRGGSSISIFA